MLECCITICSGKPKEYYENILTLVNRYKEEYNEKLHLITESKSNGIGFIFEEESSLYFSRHGATKYLKFYFDSDNIDDFANRYEFLRGIQDGIFNDTKSDLSENKLSEFPTKSLVDELATREGVRGKIVNLDEEESLSFKGPCVILAIID